MDMVNLSIIDRTLVSVTREMGITMMKTSYSTLFNEGLDFTCALADVDGEMIAVADYIPAQIGGMPLVIKTMIRELRLSEEIEPGDVIVHNDPYRGGLHTPEHTFLQPIFVDDELIGFSVVIGHVSEVGGMVPGGFPGEATEIFHEGLRVPPVKIRRRGVDVGDVWKLLLANVRTPRYNYGDYRAMIAATDVGERRVNDLVHKYGKDFFLETVRDLLDYSERRMRAELSALPDGKYSFTDYMEDDGVEEKIFTFVADAYLQGDELILDWSHSSPQAKGPINATLGVAWSAVFNAVLHLTDPSIPRNSGCFRPIKVIAPGGTVVNVDYPGPSVGGNSETAPRMAYTVIGALAQAAPKRAAATDGGTNTCFVFGGRDPRSGEYFSTLDFMVAGWGGRSFADGNDAQCVINGNCRFTPTEVFETRYPWRVEEMRLAGDSGGAGKFRGGLGVSKTLLCLEGAEITFSQVSDRYKIAPWGLFGGKEGGNGSFFFLRQGSEEWLTIQRSTRSRRASFRTRWRGAAIVYGSPRLVVVATATPRNARSR